MTTSRYDTNKTSLFSKSNGETVVYLQRRILPQPDSFATLRVRTVEQDHSQRGVTVPLNDKIEPPALQFGTRLDMIAWEEFQDPELFWLLCDANGAMRPDDLEIVGTKLRIPLPAGVPATPND